MQCTCLKEVACLKKRKKEKRKKHEGPQHTATTAYFY
jgi:hypothetical protein